MRWESAWLTLRCSLMAGPVARAQTLDKETAVLAGNDVLAENAAVACRHDPPLSGGIDGDEAPGASPRMPAGLRDQTRVHTARKQSLRLAKPIQSQFRERSRKTPEQNPLAAL